MLPARPHVIADFACGLFDQHGSGLSHGALHGDELQPLMLEHAPPECAGYAASKRWSFRSCKYFFENDVTENEKPDTTLTCYSA
jgi:hypothetical protein